MWLKLSVSPHGFRTNSRKCNACHQNTARYYVLKKIIVWLIGRIQKKGHRQTVHNVVSDLGLQCLLTGFSIKNRIKATKQI